ncbi:MAG: maleylpyruvate isomerase N-terminal domain-containing protein, partial [Acidimicrobiia bacterium]
MYAEAYRRGQDRVVSFMVGRDPEVNVPATPDWTAADVVRHLSGLAADLTSGVVEGYASDPWTARQVAMRQEMSLEDVVEEWNSAVDAAAEVLDNPEAAGFPAIVSSDAGSFPRDALPAMAISDILHHEF